VGFAEALGSPYSMRNYGNGRLVTFSLEAVKDTITVIGATEGASPRSDREEVFMSSLLDCHILEEDWRKEARQRNGASTAPARLPRSNGDQKAVLDAGPWEPAVEEMAAFQHLGDDWDGQGARAPSHEILVSAIGLAYTLHERGVEPPSRIVPGPDGSVIFEWQDPDGTYTEIEIVGWLAAEVMRIEPGQLAKHWTLPTE
jgi:hypothetical protein